MTLVGVHGVWNYRAGQEPEAVALGLGEAWRKHLAEGPLGSALNSASVRVAYYSHHLRKPGRQGPADALEDLEPDAEQMLRSWLELWDVDPAVAQGPGTAPIRQALSWIAARQGLSKLAVERFVSRFFREVAYYLADEESAQRAAARNEVVQAIRSAERPRVVLAHSLGSVVAYEALWSEPDFEVDLLVTLGSPLALPHAVFPRLRPRNVDNRGARPPSVGHWANAADVGDLVALPRRGLPRHFSGVEEDEEASIHAFDFHSVANYLRCPAVAGMVRPYL